MIVDVVVAVMVVIMDVCGGGSDGGDSGGRHHEPRLGFPHNSDLQSSPRNAPETLLVTQGVLKWKVVQDSRRTLNITDKFA
jgi:hypothetical protein